MKRYLILTLKIALVVAAVCVLFFVLSRRAVPEEITYGASFSKLHADELNLDWKEVYAAILDDLGVRHLRLSAHWTMIEPRDGEYDWGALDYQIDEAGKRGADIILAVGWRVPGWPECHTPDWALNFSRTERQEKILEYLNAVVGRYKNKSNIRMWQVENEGFLNFAGQYCEPADEPFLAKEIALVRELDPNRKILITDSGEFGKWYKARAYGDVFGTSVYLYIWHDILGPLRYPITPGFFRFKQNLIDFVSGPKESILIELGAEPWLMQPIVKAPLSLQLNRMGTDKWNEVIEFNRQTGFAEQYLWGAEWWYYMKGQNHPEFWEEAKKLFQN